MTGDISRALWVKSSYSTGSGGNCVEVARNLPGVVAVRDSKHPGGPALVLSPRAWVVFARAVKAGELGQA